MTIDQAAQVTAGTVLVGTVTRTRLKGGQTVTDEQTVEVTVYRVGSIPKFGHKWLELKFPRSSYMPKVMLDDAAALAVWTVKAAG